MNYGTYSKSAAGDDQRDDANTNIETIGTGKIKATRTGGGVVNGHFTT